MQPNKLLTNLKIDLSLNSTNSSSGSGLGGSASQYLFMISHNSILKPSQDHNIHFEDDGSNSMTISIPDNAKLKSLREVLNQFYQTTSLKKEEIDFVKLSDLAWLESQNFTTDDGKALISAIKDVNQLKDQLEGQKTIDQLLIDRIKAAPSYVVCLSFRLVISLEGMVKYNLDDHISFKDVLGKFNN